MFGSAILDVAIGLIVVFSLMSLVVAAVRELLEGWFRTRARMLERGIIELLSEPPALAGSDAKQTTPSTEANAHGTSTLVERLYHHPLVYPLYEGPYRSSRGLGRLQRWLGASPLPTYIPAPSFAKALLDMAAHGDAQATGDAPTDALALLRRGHLPNLRSPAVSRVLRTALDHAGTDLASVQAEIEAWFNSAMAHVSSAYKRRTQAYLLLLGFAVAVALNVNAVAIARYLYRDAGARAAMVASADALAKDTSIRQVPLDTLLSRMARLELPIGWTRRPAAPGAPDSSRADSSAADSTLGSALNPFDWSIWRLVASSPPSSLIGWLMTAVAVSLGAPFWFDLLSRVMAVRSSVKPKDDEDEKESQEKPDK